MSDTTVSTSRFSTVLATFAAAIGVDLAKVDEIVLASSVNDRSDASLSILGDSTTVTDADWSSMFPVATFPTAKPPVLRAAVKALRESIVPSTPSVSTVVPAVVPATSVLKRLGDDASFLSGLISGGTLNGQVTPLDAVAALRVSFANKANLYTLRSKLLEKIGDAAEALDVPADAERVYKLMDDVQAEDFAPLFRAMKVPAKSVGAADRKRLLARLDTIFVPGVLRFYDALATWYDQVRLQKADPSHLIDALTNRLSGLVPESVEVASLRSAAAEFADAVNKTFRGLNYLASVRIMAKDAVDLVDLLRNATYMDAAGFKTLDEMKRGLGVNLSEAEARASISLGEFVLNALDIPNVPDATLATVAQHLYLLGSQSISALRNSSPDRGGAVRREEPFGSFPGEVKARR